MQIFLMNGYYIEIDPLNYTLRQKYKGTKKDGVTPRDGERIHGYFSNLDSALAKFIALNQIDSGSDLALDLYHYVEFVSDANLNAVQALKSVLDGNHDDVCEWKLEDEEANLYLTGCQQRQLLFDGTPKENGYRYCPYCGKKIKVVE